MQSCWGTAPGNLQAAKKARCKLHTADLPTLHARVPLLSTHAEPSCCIQGYTGQNTLPKQMAEQMVQHQLTNCLGSRMPEKQLTSTASCSTVRGGQG